jgi:hypothetical protein
MSQSITNPLCISINPSYAATYVQTTTRRKTSHHIKQYEENFKKVRKTNHLSANSKRKLRKSILWMAKLATEKRVFVKQLDRAIKFKLSFITLTLPSKQIHTDTEIKRECLNYFLQWLRDSRNVKSYVWKAEIQKNGNIHFHITTDAFIHYQDVRNKWNQFVNRLGYVDRYHQSGNEGDPPSTEIKSVKKVKNIAAYLVAYLSDGNNKSNKKNKAEYHSRVIDGRLYGVSRYLSNIKSLVIEEGTQLFNYVLQYLEGLSTKVIRKEYISVFMFQKGMFEEIVSTFTELIGFDWLANSGFDLEHIGQLSSG